MTYPRPVIERIEIHPDLVRDPSPARAAERTVAIHDLQHGAVVSRPGPYVLLVASEGEDLALVWRRDEEAVRAPIPMSALRPHLDEYLWICRTLGQLDDEGAASPRLEALDMAKKVAHDDAAKTLASLSAHVTPDHATARRLFTLLLCLLVDTTRISVLHRHR